MRVGLALGRGYEEEQRRRLPVERLVVHPRGDRHGGEARRRDRRGLGVRDGDAVPEAGRELPLALADGGGVRVAVAHVALGDHEIDELVDGLVLAPRRAPYPDSLGPQQIRDSHPLVLSSLFFRKVVPTPGAHAWWSC